MAMKRIILGIVAVLCAVLFVSTAFAGEQEGVPWFKPALSAGYAFNAGDTNFTFITRGISLLGVTRMDIKPPRLSGVYVAGELPFAVTDRLKLTLEGSWTMSLTDKDLREDYNSVVAVRSWDPDNNSQSWTADFLASYAFVKNFSFIKDVSVAAGVRWDYHTMSFDKPIATGVVSAPGDTIDLSTHTLAPVFGITSTFKGFKSGIFGGDMKLGFLAGPIVWGQVNYRESFGIATKFRSDDDLSNGYLLKIFGEITALSGKITPGIDGSLSVFAQYTRSKTGGTLDISSSTGTTAGFDFDTASDVMAVGIKAAITF
jgi:hypothetical protein